MNRLRLFAGVGTMRENKSELTPGQKHQRVWVNTWASPVEQCHTHTWSDTSSHTHTSSVFVHFSCNMSTSRPPLVRGVNSFGRRRRFLMNSCSVLTTKPKSHVNVWFCCRWGFLFFLLIVTLWSGCVLSLTAEAFIIDTKLVVSCWSDTNKRLSDQSFSLNDD